MSGDTDRAQFLAELDRELRVRGPARVRIMEEIRAHLHEAGEGSDVLAGFGSPARLAAGFNGLHATQSAQRVLGRLAVVGPALFATYVASFLLVWTGQIPTSPVQRLTPRLYEDIGVISALGTSITSLGFVAAMLALAAFAVALGLPALRKRAALGLAVLAAIALPPLAVIAHLAARDDPWLLAPAAVSAALAIVVGLPVRDRRQTAVTLAILALTALGLIICASVAMTVLNGLPAPTTALSALRYLQLALLPVCFATLVGAYQTRLSGTRLAD